MSRIETHYELFILLGNTLTISMPFKMENGEITCTGMQSLRLSTSFGINNKQITIGYITDGKANSVDEDSICGFVDCFASREYVPDMDEMQRNCSCNVRKNLDGRIEYEVSHMNNQTLTPAIALQLFIKYLIIHEKARSNVSFSRVTIAYPVYFTESTVQYLEYLFQSCLMIPLRCVSQLMCFVSGFGIHPIPATECRTLVLFADYSLFHVFACTHTSSRVMVRSHLETSRLSHSQLVHITVDEILRSLDGITGLNVAKESMNSLFNACYQMLNKYAIQSVATLELSVNGIRYKRTFTDAAIFQILSPLFSLLTADISTLCAKLQWEPSSLSRIILTGEASSLFVFRRWLQRDFSSVDTCCCYDVPELLRSIPNLDSVLEWKEAADSTEPVEAKRAETEADAMLPTSLFDVLHHRRRKEAVPISEEALEVTETVATPLSFKVSLDAKDAEMIYCGDTPEPKKLMEEVAVESAKLRNEVKLKVTKPTRSTRGRKPKRDQVEKEIKETEEKDKEETEEKEKETIEKETEEKKEMDKEEEEGMEEDDIEEEETEEKPKEENIKKRKRRRQSVNWDALTIISGPRKASLTALEMMRKQLTSRRKRRGKKEEKEEEKVTKEGKKETKKPKEKEKRKKKEEREPKEIEKKEKKEKKEIRTRKESISSPVPVPPFHINSFRLLPTERPLHEWTLLPKHTIVQPATLGTQQDPWDENLVSPLYTAPELQKAISTPLDGGLRLHHYSNGAMYSGGVEKGKRSGSGKLTYPDGASYQGEFVENAREGSGTMRKKNKCFFRGVFEADAPKKGLLTYGNGARYSGSFDAGLPHGEGTFYGNGQEALWEGQWSHGRMDGVGTYFFDNGNYFDGRMKDGLPEGEGALCDKKGNILLKGRWKEGRRDGEFLAFFPDGSYCSVTYEEDVKNGPCAFYDTQKSLVGTGNFEKDVFSGKGRFLFADGSVYEGGAKDGEYDGEGKFTFPDSLVIQATYVRDQKNGEVEITKDNQLIFKGTCKKNKVDGPGTEYVDGNVVYEGNYTSGLPHGKGTVFFDNGMRYYGTVKKGVISGLGVITDKDGSEVHKGSFRQNKFIASK